MPYNIPGVYTGGGMKPENRFIQGIHRLLEDVYHEKMNNPWRAGTADVWYSGNLADLWVEYKYQPTVPIRNITLLPDLTPRQLKWLEDRCLEGRNIAVISGYGDGGIVYVNQEWRTPIQAGELKKRALTKSEIAQWIRNKVGASPCKLGMRCKTQHALSLRATGSS